MGQSAAIAVEFQKLVSVDMQAGVVSVWIVGLTNCPASLVVSSTLLTDIQRRSNINEYTAAQSIIENANKVGAVLDWEVAILVALESVEREIRLGVSTERFIVRTESQSLRSSSLQALQMTILLIKNSISQSAPLTCIAGVEKDSRQSSKLTGVADHALAMLEEIARGTLIVARVISAIRCLLPAVLATRGSHDDPVPDGSEPRHLILQ